MITFENDRFNYCVRWPDDPRCSAGYDVVGGGGGGGTGPTRSGPAPTDVFYAKARLAELDGLIAQATSPENLFPSKRYIRALLAEKKKLLKKLSGFAKRGMYGMGEVSGLSTVGWLVAGFLVYKYFIKGR
jgi:hypothetical protein